MDERTYFVQLGSLERGPFSRSEIGLLYSSGVIGLDTKLSTRNEKNQTTVAKAIFPFAVEFAGRKIPAGFTVREPNAKPTDDAPRI